MNGGVLGYIGYGSLGNGDGLQITEFRRIAKDESVSHKTQLVRQDRELALEQTCLSHFLPLCARCLPRTYCDDHMRSGCSAGVHATAATDSNSLESNISRPFSRPRHLNGRPDRATVQAC